MRGRAKLAWLGWLGAAAGGVLLASPARGADEASPPASGDAPCPHCHEAKGTAGTGAAPDAPDGGYARSERSYVVPDVTLVDAGARPVRLRDALAADEPVMLNFIFTTCTAICPVMTGIFARVPKALGADAERVRLISISIDPEQDTPARLRAYATRFGAGPRWQFLTGDRRDVEAVERAFDAYRGDKMNHEPLTLVRAGAGRPWVRLDGFASAEELAREYAEAAAR